MKNILVIGGSYFLGRVFVEEMAQDPDNSLYVVNRGNRPLNMPAVQELRCDRNDVAGMRAILPHKTWDAVVDFCAYAPQDVDNLMRAMTTDRIKHYVLISTASVYAPTKIRPVRENAPIVTAPQPALGPAASYGYLKALSEQTARRHCTQRSVPYTCLRPTIIYGRYNYAPRESYFFDLVRRGEPVVIPEHDLPLFQFVLVDDAARAIARCMGNSATNGKTFNVSAEELISYGRLVEVVEAVSGKTISIQPMDVATIDRLRIPLPFPLDDHLIYSGSLLQETLDFSFTPFHAGMQSAYDWYRQSMSTTP
jgi:nucleoside-diphosphate-sugar epimerase